MNKMIRHNSVHVEKSDILAVSKVLKSGWVAGGKEVKKLEKNFRDYFSSEDCCAVSSGTAALFLALKVLNIKDGSKIGIPSYTCSSLLNAIYLLRLNPKVFDVYEDSYLVNFEKLNDCEAVIPVHTYGNLVNPKTIKCRNIIEDCCHVISNKIDKNKNLKVSSFYATKPLQSGHGGVICGPKKKIEEIRDYISFDGRKKYKPRFNFLLSDINAALINSQFNRINKIKKKKNYMFNAFKRVVPVMWNIQKGFSGEAVPYKFVINGPSKKEKERLQKYLKKNKIESVCPVKNFELLHNYLNLSTKKFPNSEKVAERSLSIPFHYGLNDSEIKKITTILKNYQ